MISNIVLFVGIAAAVANCVMIWKTSREMKLLQRERLAVADQKLALLMVREEVEQRLQRLKEKESGLMPDTRDYLEVVT